MCLNADFDIDLASSLRLLAYCKYIGFIKYFEMHDEPELEEFAAPPLTLVKIIPIIAALVMLGDIVAVYEPLAVTDCSDVTTSAGFQLLAEELPKAYMSSILNMIMDCVILAYTLFTLVRKKIKADILSVNTR